MFLHDQKPLCLPLPSPRAQALSFLGVVALGHGGWGCRGPQRRRGIPASFLVPNRDCCKSPSIHQPERVSKLGKSPASDNVTELENRNYGSVELVQAFNPVFGIKVNMVSILRATKTLGLGVKELVYVSGLGGRGCIWNRHPSQRTRKAPVVTAPFPRKLQAPFLTHLPHEAAHRLRPWREVARSVTRCPRRLWKHPGSCPSSLSAWSERPYQKNCKGQ